MPHFFIRLIPPRLTFVQDKTEDEHKIMLEHIAYWTDLQNKGYVIVYGPVMDPKGPWGMGIIEAENEDQVAGFMVNDPTIKAGLHTMEIYPMKAVMKST